MGQRLERLHGLMKSIEEELNCSDIMRLDQELFEHLHYPLFVSDIYLK